MRNLYLQALAGDGAAQMDCFGSRTYFDSITMQRFIELLIA